jgi:hypothetical protein
MPHLWLALAVGLPGVVLFALGAPIFSWLWLRCVPVYGRARVCVWPGPCAYTALCGRVRRQPYCCCRACLLQGH